MKTKAIVPREGANRDVEEAVAYYLREASAQAALGFIDALEHAYAHELNLPGLRAWPLRRYPHIVFYVERPDCIDVWRVLHGQRDIPAWMQDPDNV